MIEKILLDYLSGALSVPVYLERPESPPTCYILLERVGGGRSNYIRSAAMAVQSIAESLYQAALLNEAVKAAMDAAATCPEISGVKLDRDYNFTDTTTREYRYQAIYDLTYY